MFEMLTEALERAAMAVHTAWNRLVRSLPLRGARIVELEPPELREIDFQPITPASASSRALPSGERVWICPVTRQSLTPGNGVWQCTQCKMPYSREGWEFLRKTARGRCCGCNG